MLINLSTVFMMNYGIKKEGPYRVLGKSVNGQFLIYCQGRSGHASSLVIDELYPPVTVDDVAKKPVDGNRYLWVRPAECTIVPESNAQAIGILRKE